MICVAGFLKYQPYLYWFLPDIYLPEKTYCIKIQQKRKKYYLFLLIR